MSVMQIGKWARGVALPPDWWVPKADGRTLDLDFGAGAYWDSIAGAQGIGAAASFDRNSQAGRFGPAGAYESIAADALRRSYDPATLASRGALIEAAATNPATYSEDFSNAAWTKSAATISADDAAAPDGATAADKLVESATTATHFLYRLFTVTAGALSTFTIFVKAAERGFLQIILDNGSSVGAYATWNLATGAVTQSAQLSTATGLVAPAAEDVGNGWWRLRITTTAGDAATSARVALVLATAGTGGFAPSYAGDGTSGAHVWGAQFEAAAAPTSYAPAGASTATRLADSLSRPWGTWGNAAAGTFRAVYKIGALTAAGRDVFSVSNAAGTAQMFLRATTGGNNLAWFLTSGGAEVGRVEAGAAVAGQREVIACSYGPAGFKISRNGAAVATNGALTTPVASPAALYIGQQYSGLHLNGWIERLSYRPEQVSNSDLQAWAAAA